MSTSVNKRRTVIVSSLLTLAMATAAIAGGLPGRFAAQRAAPPTAAALGLDATQTLAYADLQRQQRAFREAAHASIGTLLQDARVELSSNDADLTALSSEVDQTLIAIVMENRGLKRERMAFYQSLNTDQKSRVHAALLQRLERLQRLHAAVGDFLIEQP